MARLRTLLETIPCENVSTYIQSGNAVFTSSVKKKETLEKQISDAMEQEFSFRPMVLLLSSASLQLAQTNNPFPQAGSNPKSVHYYFLQSVPRQPDLEGIAELATASEEWRLISQVFYLHTPDGVRDSKLAARAEKKLGVAVTARNHSTVSKLSVMLSDR